LRVSTENSGLWASARSIRVRATRVVMLHDEAEDPVDMVKVFEGRVLIRYHHSKRLEAARRRVDR